MDLFGCGRYFWTQNPLQSWCFSAHNSLVIELSPIPVSLSFTVEVNSYFGKKKKKSKIPKIGPWPLPETKGMDGAGGRRWKYSRSGRKLLCLRAKDTSSGRKFTELPQSAWCAETSMSSSSAPLFYTWRTINKTTTMARVPSHCASGVECDRV